MKRKKKVKMSITKLLTFRCWSCTASVCWCMQSQRHRAGISPRGPVRWIFEPRMTRRHSEPNSSLCEYFDGICSVGQSQRWTVRGLCHFLWWQRGHVDQGLLPAGDIQNFIQVQIDSIRVPTYIVSVPKTWCGKRFQQVSSAQQFDLNRILQLFDIVRNPIWQIIGCDTV